MPDIESLSNNPNKWPSATVTGDELKLKRKLAAVDRAITRHAITKYPDIERGNIDSLYACGEANQKLTQLAVDLGILTPTILVPRPSIPNPDIEDKKPETRRFGMELRFPTGLEATYEVISASTWQDGPYQELRRLAVTGNRQSAGDMAMFGYQVFAYDNYAGNNPSYGGIIFAPLREIGMTVDKSAEEDRHHETVAMGYGTGLPRIGDWALLGIHLPMRLLPAEMLQSKFMDLALRKYALSERSPITDNRLMPSWEQFLEKYQEALIPKTYQDLMLIIKGHKRDLAEFDYK